MSAEILNAIPTSGQFTEIHFGAHFNSQLWIKFTDNNFQEWVGCFSKSYEKALCLVLTDENNFTSFVIAGGKGYLIDIHKREIITEIEDPSLIESAIRTTNPNFFVVGTIYNIYLLKETGLIKEIKPKNIIDGIYFKTQVGNKAIGELATAENQYEYNVDFEFDLTTFDLQLNYRTKPGLIGRLWNRLIN